MQKPQISSTLVGVWRVVKVREDQDPSLRGHLQQAAANARDDRERNRHLKGIGAALNSSNSIVR